MSMYQVLAIVPGAIAIFISTTALAAQPSLSNMRYFVQDAPSSVNESGQTAPDSGTGVIGEVSKADENPSPESTLESEDDEYEDDPNSSDAMRETKTYSAEFFLDYGTFVADQEDLSVFAYGMKGYWFSYRDLKLGASVAVEQFQLNDDESDVVTTIPSPGATPVKRLVPRNIDIEGTAARFGLHAQYFVENSMNAQFSLFVATGKTEKEDGRKAEDYSRSGISLALGNQWSWEDVTFSWNWLSLTYNFSAKMGGTNLLDKYPSNKSGGMILVSGLGFGAEW